MARRDEILAFADELLDTGSYREFGPAGAQVLGAREVTKLACGVSASLELFRGAAAAGAELLLVHHGIWWRNEPLVVDARQRGRLQALFDADLTLAAYHLPLDAHPQLGNAARLSARLGVEVEGPFLGFGVGCRPPSSSSECDRRPGASLSSSPRGLTRCGESRSRPARPGTT
jgi:putative NIF3 family GTP cyclohydrolase 1 type 2